MTLRRRTASTHRPQVVCAVETLESRALMATSTLYFPPSAQFPSPELIQPPVIRSQNGTIDATMNMVRAGFDSSPILYGGVPIYSSPAAPNPQGSPPAPVYAMAYQIDAYGQSLPAQYPGPMFQLNPGETLNLRVNDNLAGEGETNVLFQTNFHSHGLHVSELSDGDNVYRELFPGQGMDVSIPIPDDAASGLNWYHVHRHMSTHPQVYGGLAGTLLVGDALDPWPQYKGTVTQAYLNFSEVNIQNGKLVSYNAGASGSTFTTGWQKRINGQVNPTIRLRPGETQVWNMASIGPFGSINPAITDSKLANPRNAPVLVQDGNGKFVNPYSLTLAADKARMEDLVSSTLIMPGNRLTMAVTAPLTPGTYYLIDGWGGQDRPAIDGKGNSSYYSLATIVVEGAAVTTPAPVFAPTGVNPLFSAVPDVKRTYEFAIVPGANPDQNVFTINGKVFGEGIMPQLQIGTVEEWTLTNPKIAAANANHPFHIHQGDFIVVAVNGVAVDPAAKPPPGKSSLAYVSGRDVIDIPSGGSVTIRFFVEDFPGKYVFHCHILKHEDQGMMSPVLQFGPAAGLRMTFGPEGTPGSGVTVLNGRGENLGTIKPFGKTYKGGIASASALGASAFNQTIALAKTGSGSTVRVYDDGSLTPTKSFKAFGGKKSHGLSVAVGDLNADGKVVIAVASKGPGKPVVRLFDAEGKMIRQYHNVLPGKSKNGWNLAVGDVDGDNFDDLIVSAPKGRSPMVTALDGYDIAMGKSDPARIFTFMAAGGKNAGARVALGYVAPSSTPSYLPNLMTTAEQGAQAGTVSVWNVSTLAGSGGHDMSSMGRKATTKAVPSPMLTYKPFAGRAGKAVQLGSNYLGRPGTPVITAWIQPKRVAFTSVDLTNTASTQVRNLD